jgi:hypothetical protein
LVRVDPSQNLSYPIRAGFFLADQPLHPLGLAHLVFHRVQTSLPQDKQKKDTAPDRRGGDLGAKPAILQLGYSGLEIKDLRDKAAEPGHHDRLPRSCSFVFKKRSQQFLEICSMSCQAC